MITIAIAVKMAGRPDKSEVLAAVIDGKKGVIYRAGPDHRIPEGAIRVDRTVLGTLRRAVYQQKTFSET